MEYPGKKDNSMRYMSKFVIEHATIYDALW